MIKRGIKMDQIILDFPKQFRVGIEIAEKIKVSRNFNRIIICGMGGSALSADILKIWLEFYKIKCPIIVHRNYNLPYWVSEQDLIVCVSYSGNTEETLSAFEEAQKRKNRIIAITTGGQLAILCEKYKIPVAIMPAGLPPRMALGIQFAALIKILVNCGVLINKERLEEVLSLERSLKPKELESQGKKISEKIGDKIPIFYASERLKALTQNWKINFNESPRIPTFVNYFPELNHGEMAGFEKSRGNFQVIIFKDPTDHQRILKRMELTASIIGKRGIEVSIVELKEGDILNKIFSNIILALWSAYWLAIKLRVDPLSTETIEEFKQKLIQE